jgi:hypothetical protein
LEEKMRREKETNDRVVEKIIEEKSKYWQTVIFVNE